METEKILVLERKDSLIPNSRQPDNPIGAIS